MKSLYLASLQQRSETERKGYIDPEELKETRLMRSLRLTARVADTHISCFLAQMMFRSL
jgi:hypothetical protein